MSYCPTVLAANCHHRVCAYRGPICAPWLNDSHASAVPLPPPGTPGISSDPNYARGNVEYARLVKETVQHLVKAFGVDEVRTWRFEGWNEPNGGAGASWGNHTALNEFGSHNFSTSLYPAWYRAVSEAVVSVDSHLKVGGPASSDCWGFGEHRGGGPVDAGSCHGTNDVAPSVANLLAAPTRNWALAIVEWGKKEGVRVDFSSSHAYSDPCGNATGLYLALKLFHGVIGASSAPETPPIVTEWSSNSLPDGVNCTDIYPSDEYPDPAVRNRSIDFYHDQAAQASFATRTVFLVGDLFDILSHWAFSDVFEEQGWSWEVFNGGFGLVNRFGVRKPVFNAFKLLHDAGDERWNVTLRHGRSEPAAAGGDSHYSRSRPQSSGDRDAAESAVSRSEEQQQREELLETLAVFAGRSNDGKSVDLVLSNHESPSVNVTVALKVHSLINTMNFHLKKACVQKV
jgi:hypothetical protein